jgi:hypothetical protein
MPNSSMPMGGHRASGWDAEMMEPGELQELLEWVEENMPGAADRWRTARRTRGYGRDEPHDLPTGSMPMTGGRMTPPKDPGSMDNRRWGGRGDGGQYHHMAGDAAPGRMSQDERMASMMNGRTIGYV